MALDAYAAATDEALLTLYGNGDPSAAQILTTRLAPRVLGYASRLLGGDRAEAEDVTQEAMLRLWKQAPKWRTGEAKISTWLYTVVTNLCTDRLRKRRSVDIDDDNAISAAEFDAAQKEMWMRHGQDHGGKRHGKSGKYGG